MARRPAAKQKMVTMDRAELQATTCWASCSSPPISWTITALVTATGEQKMATTVGISSAVMPSGSRSSTARVSTIPGTTTRRMATAAVIFFHRPCTASNRSRAPRITSTSGEAARDRSPHTL